MKYKNLKNPFKAFEQDTFINDTAIISGYISKSLKSEYDNNYDKPLLLYIATANGTFSYIFNVIGYCSVVPGFTFKSDEAEVSKSDILISINQYNLLIKSILLLLNSIVVE